MCFNLSLSEEISEVRSELQEEGFTSDEASKLIQNVYRKVSACKSHLGSPRRDLIEEQEETKSWQDAMCVMRNLMQVCTTSNLNVDLSLTISISHRVFITTMQTFMCPSKRAKIQLNLKISKL